MYRVLDRKGFMSDLPGPGVLGFREAVGLGADLLGGKGAGLAAMLARGLRVPPGFIVTTTTCNRFRLAGDLSPEVRDQVRAALTDLERQRGRRLGDVRAPLLVAVRSGAPVSMPGMMDTVLNLGVDDQTVQSLADEFGQDFAYDCYARLLEGFATVVLGVDADRFKSVHEPSSRARVDDYRAVIEEAYGPFPEDPHVQLELAITAVLRSWNNPRAAAYRRIEGIDDAMGTAVVVQSMVFGNLSAASGTGVVFTRDPNTGEREPYGDFLFRAQGEDVVSGTRQTLPIGVLAERLPDVWDELSTRLAALEEWKRDVLDVEFTVEDGQLFFLQVRSAKRSPVAAVRVARSMVDEGMISRAEALMRVTPAQLDALVHSRRRSGASVVELTRGLGASPGLATGAICLTTEAVLDCADRGAPAILVRLETSPEDVQGMAEATGILTARGGLVSHAAVVARGLAVPAVVGADGIRIDRSSGTVDFGGTVLREGDVITIDGESGAVELGTVSAEDAGTGETDELLAWVDEVVGSADGAPADAAPSARLEAARNIVDAAGYAAELGARGARA
jgi:pyruvate,orthophosphate dikinase